MSAKAATLNTYRIRFYQEASLRVHDNATLLYSEMITPGRVASGEHFDYDICYMKAVAKNQKDDLRLIDVAMLEPKKRNMKLFGVLEGYEVVGSMYVLTNSGKAQEINNEISSNLQMISNVYSGATILPNNCGVMVRMLGSTASDLRAAIYEVVRTVRKMTLGAPFSGIRKG
jgi:urease accessory protein